MRNLDLVQRPVVSTTHQLPLGSPPEGSTRKTTNASLHLAFRIKKKHPSSDQRSNRLAFTFSKGAPFSGNTTVAQELYFLKLRSSSPSSPFEKKQPHNPGVQRCSSDAKPTTWFPPPSFKPLCLLRLQQHFFKVSKLFIQEGVTWPLPSLLGVPVVEQSPGSLFLGSMLELPEKSSLPNLSFYCHPVGEKGPHFEIIIIIPSPAAAFIFRTVLSGSYLHLSRITGGFLLEHTRFGPSILAPPSKQLCGRWAGRESHHVSDSVSILRLCKQMHIFFSAGLCATS